MEVAKTEIPGVLLVQPDIYSDDRGYFLEVYRDSWLEHILPGSKFVQENLSFSHQGVLRGLHYQIWRPQGKLIQVIRGEVYDVAVDLRRSSNTFGQYVGLKLSANKKNMLWIPPGFAHGFYSLSKAAEVMYRCTDYYAPNYERTLRWNDPTLNISWPLINNSAPQLSEKDKVGILFQNAEYYYQW